MSLKKSKHTIWTVIASILNNCCCSIRPKTVLKVAVETNMVKYLEKLEYLFGSG